MYIRTDKVLFARISADLLLRLQALAKQQYPGHHRPLNKYLRAELPGWVKRLEKKSKKNHPAP